jgi:SAM-dependent methyltransferase
MNRTTYNDCSRSRWHGVGQIIRFNWRFYLAGAATLAVGISAVLVVTMPLWLRNVSLGCLALVAFWTVMSLAVSHWVYDLSVITRWTWIARYLPEAPRRWANIHAGLDESSPALKKLFPDAQGEILDIFDPAEMTEASIAEARCHAGNDPDATVADLRRLPLADNQYDALFLIFAAHEIRHPDARRQFFTELKRALKPGGRVLIVEHLRDWKNFIAYGPGCFHFQSRATWHGAASGSGLAIEKEFGITPFVRIFLLRKPSLI